jgi:hypothetical protein
MLSLTMSSSEVHEVKYCRTVASNPLAPAPAREANRQQGRRHPVLAEPITMPYRAKQTTVNEPCVTEPCRESDSWHRVLGLGISYKTTQNTRGRKFNLILKERRVRCRESLTSSQHIKLRPQPIISNTNNVTVHSLNMLRHIRRL